MKKIDPLFDVKVISDREVAYGLGTSEPGKPLGMYVPYWVSTVLLGLDHGFPAEAGTGGPPVLWETMIFGAWEEYEIIPGKPRRCRKDIDQIRYTSKAEALAGHAKAVKLAESLPRPWP